MKKMLLSTMIIMIFLFSFIGNAKIHVQSISAPSTVKAGEEFYVDVTYWNDGVWEEINSEVCVFPDRWRGIAFGLMPFSSWSISKCCVYNEFCTAKRLSIGSFNHETVRYYVTAPNKNSIDYCNNLGSAWDTSHEIVAGTYEYCGGGYVSMQTKNIQISEDEPPPSTCGNGVCEPQLGENFITCKRDCNTCGNTICDVKLGETYQNCPSDCKEPNDNQFDWNNIYTMIRDNFLIIVIVIVFLFYLFSSRKKG